LFAQFDHYLGRYLRRGVVERFNVAVRGGPVGEFVRRFPAELRRGQRVFDYGFNVAEVGGAGVSYAAADESALADAAAVYY
jgi:hypothetical protein